MIEGLQVAVHMPLFDVKTPGNVNSFNGFFIEMATFDVIDTTEASNSFGYVPEKDAISLNYQMAGYDNNLVVSNLGTLYYLVIGQMSFAFIHLILYILSKFWTKADKTRDWISKYLYFNGSIRFMMEGYMDIVLFSLMNIEGLEWSDSFWAV